MSELESAGVLQPLTQRWQYLQERVARACERAGRSPQDITIVAVTKAASEPQLQAAYALGLRDLGESRPQQLARRSNILPTDTRWHLIGHLQRNKLALACRHAWMIHSVDRWSLWHSLFEYAERAVQPLPRLLIEVNVSGEGTKQGFSPEELRQHADRWFMSSAIQPLGLMTMAPLTADPERVRPVFRQLRAIRDELRQLTGRPDILPQLSMGMSGDFEVAIEEGATMIRIGSLLFAPDA
ncbi:MAG: YggS family pyridoxal phosphate enzyme [Planctomycetaceae bacterium]|nr:MAG: YggS family pyridoxal phosphate enzyme [Planctomycetaceae bacterium]